MKITNEIKAKVFAQYLGQKILFAHQDKWQNGMFCTPSTLNNIECGLTNHTNLKLIIKPPYAITDKDATDLAKIVFSKESHNAESGKWYIDTYFIKKKLENTSANTYLSVCQYLISKGYDIPQYVLKNKTLQQSGLAIYEN